ncbi:unnamed protein product [Allacma fusca]|uniref:Uncharacterized protein n=1 Tax=Allacma fusca TaxID=39272 RepID=A0A8J2P7U1_9HEXA|nr:unnamed protein product [Allacma fusca]
MKCNLLSTQYRDRNGDRMVWSNVPLPNYMVQNQNGNTRVFKNPDLYIAAKLDRNNVPIHLATAYNDRPSQGNANFAFGKNWKRLPTTIQQPPVNTGAGTTGSLMSPKGSSSRRGSIGNNIGSLMNTGTSMGRPGSPQLTQLRPPSPPRPPQTPVNTGVGSIGSSMTRKGSSSRRASLGNIFGSSMNTGTPMSRPGSPQLAQSRPPSPPQPPQTPVNTGMGSIGSSMSRKGSSPRRASIGSFMNTGTSMSRPGSPQFAQFRPPSPPRPPQTPVNTGAGSIGSSMSRIGSSSRRASLGNIFGSSMNTGTSMSRPGSPQFTQSRPPSPPQTHVNTGVGSIGSSMSPKGSSSRRASLGNIFGSSMNTGTSMSRPGSPQLAQPRPPSPPQPPQYPVNTGVGTIGYSMSQKGSSSRRSSIGSFMNTGTSGSPQSRPPSPPQSGNFMPSKKRKFSRGGA